MTQKNSLYVLITKRSKKVHKTKEIAKINLKKNKNPFLYMMSFYIQQRFLFLK